MSVIIIGRGKECDWAVQNKQVSRKHCKIMMKDGEYFIKDLNSSNGTFVNREKITGDNYHQIRLTDSIVLADDESLDWDEILKRLPKEETEARKPARKVKSAPSDSEPEPARSARHQPVPPQPQYAAPDTPMRGVGNELVYAMHATKSYVAAGFLTLILYFIAFWIGGLIANILYLSEANQTKNYIGHPPPGYGFLWVLMWIFVFAPLIVTGIVFIIAATTGMQMSEYYDFLQSQ